MRAAAEAAGISKSLYRHCAHLDTSAEAYADDKLRATILDVLREELERRDGPAAVAAG